MAQKIIQKLPIIAQIIFLLSNCLPGLEIDGGLGAGAHVRNQLGARVDQGHHVETAPLGCYSAMSCLSPITALTLLDVPSFARF